MRPDRRRPREGNVFVGASMKTLKWTRRQMAKYDSGQVPARRRSDRDRRVRRQSRKGFKEADLIVERDMHQQTTSHQPMESRSCMAYWQNGKCYMHVSTQTLARTVAFGGGMGRASSPMSSC
jgi:CO/xanthine dehydrogenase Mo-binding subunit